MKKTYQNPQTDIIILSVASHVLVGSGGLLGDGEKPKDLNLEDVAETTETSGNLSRRTVWDDDELEEEEF